MTKSLIADRRQQVYKFLLWVTIFWVVGLLVWNLISPWYGRVLARATTSILNKNPLIDCEVSYRFEQISIKAHTYFSVRKAPDGAKEYYEGDPSWDGRRFHFSFTVWIALLLATPFDWQWKKKLLWFLVGWLVIFATQVLGLFLQTVHQNMLFVKTLLMSGGYLQPTSTELTLAFGGRYFLLIGNVLFPLLIWLPIGIERLNTLPSGVMTETIPSSAAPSSP